MQQAIEILKQEYDWHSINQGTSAKGAEWEKGFIDGIEHAMLLLGVTNEFTKQRSVA